MVEDYSCACQRERGKKKEEEEKSPEKKQKKPLRRNWDLNPRTLSPEPSVLSIRPRRPTLFFSELSPIAGSLEELNYWSRMVKQSVK